VNGGLSGGVANPTTRAPTGLVGPALVLGSNPFLDLALQGRPLAVLGGALAGLALVGRRRAQWG